MQQIHSLAVCSLQGWLTSQHSWQLPKQTASSSLLDCNFAL